MIFLESPILMSAMAALFLLSFLTAPMGCFTVWKRLSYFGATLSHASLLGAVLGVLLGTNISITLTIFTLILALGLSYGLSQTQIANDTFLGFSAHLSLAIAIVVIALMKDLRIDLMSYLTGSILAVSTTQLYLLFFTAIISSLILAKFWREMILIILSKSIARSENIAVFRNEVVLILLLAITVSLGIQIIGVLLMVSLLIIPAASARFLAKSSISMLFYTWVLTIFSNFLGLFVAYYVDLPAGATIVCIMGFIFLIIQFFRRR